MSNPPALPPMMARRSEEHTSELQSLTNLVCRPPISTLFPYTTLFRSVVILFVVGIAPLLVFADRKRQRGVEARIQRIDERHHRDDHGKQVGPEVCDGAHEQSAGAAAHDGKEIGRAHV